MTTEVVVALVTAPQAEAQAVARAILEPKLAACINIIPAVRAMYWWEGEVQDDTESLLVVKTTKAAIAAVEQAVRKTISYEVFELLVLDVSSGNPAYLDWVHATVG